MGGSKTPSAPAQPTATGSMNDFVNNYPRLFQLEQQYAPQEAQLNLDMAKQYALPMSQALKDAQDQLYPDQAKLRDTITQQAVKGVDSDVPSWMQDAYRSNMNAQLGANVNSPIGADYMSRGLLQQKQDWQNYYRSLGMQISSGQPIYNAQPAQYTNQLANYTPQGVMNFNQQGYGTAAGIYGHQLQNSGGNMGGMGAALGTGLGMLLAAPTGGMSMAAGGMLGGMMGGGAGSMIKY